MKYQHILVAIELSDDNNRLIKRAKFLSQLVNAGVSLIYIDGTVGEIYPELIDIKADPAAKPLNEHANEQLKRMLNELDIPVEHFFVGTGDLSDKLKVTLKDHDIDLLICGHHHDFLSKLVSYSRHLINQSTVDVLVVPL